MIWIKMTPEDVDRAARLWNRGYDTAAIAEILFGNKGKEPDIYRMLHGAIIVRAREMRQAAQLAAERRQYLREVADSE